MLVTEYIDSPGAEIGLFGKNDVHAIVFDVLAARSLSRLVTEW